MSRKDSGKEMEEFINAADIFGENVFNDSVMQERLPKKIYAKLREIIRDGGDLDLDTAPSNSHDPIP